MGGSGISITNVMIFTDGIIGQYLSSSVSTEKNKIRNERNKQKKIGV
jgi:hypothetical protein